MSLSSLLDRMEKEYALVPRELGQYAEIKKNGMHFHINAYEIPGVGRMSAIRMSAMLGLMKMETVVISPLTKDAPLFSFDDILAMGNDTLLLELYDTQLSPVSVDALTAVKEKYAALPDNDLGQHWYDHLKMQPSLSKKGKKKAVDFEPLFDEFFAAYLELLRSAPPCDREAKQAKVREYAQGLLTNGGPSTDQFKKLIGADATAELFLKYVFSGMD